MWGFFALRDGRHGNNRKFARMQIEFGKYEGAGNDFVIIDNRDGEFEPRSDLVAALCHRRFGVGADGLMLLERDGGTDFRMRYFNSDGPEATMCSNGGRCIALFALHAGAAGERMTFAAADGVHRASILSQDADSAAVELLMTEPRGLSEIEGGYFVDTGSPHCVRFVEDAERVDVPAEGRRIRNLPRFAAAGGVNVDFVEPAGGNLLRVRTYERGVEDETLACGTGAVAAALAASAAFAPQVRNFDVRVCGGMLHVAFGTDGERFTDVRLTGPARRVYAGVFDTENFQAVPYRFGKIF